MFGGQSKPTVTPPQNFATDWGHPYEFAGRERVYEPGVRHFVDNEPQDLEWAVGDEIIAALPSLIANQSHRNAPSLPQLPELVLGAIGLMNVAFYQAACQLTNEPNLDAIKLKQWDDKFAIATDWHKAGRPSVTADNYPDAVLEASNRADQYTDPNKLIASWYVNGVTWNGINQKYRAIVEPAKRAWIRSSERTIEELMAVTLPSLTADIVAALLG